ncbi:unnamed protein product [Symbiodinium sp. CCMP2592]|nr:unnamed protein product [Symbiodinium sp. CCMP2592]
MGDSMDATSLDMDQILGIIEDVHAEGQTKQRDQVGTTEKRQKRSLDNIGLGPGSAKKPRAKSKLSKNQVFHDQQSRAYNASGRARNQDFHMPLHEFGLDRQPVGGRGQWRVWSSPAVLRAAFSSEKSTCRQIKDSIEGAGRRNSSGSRYVVAEAILHGQAVGIQKLQKPVSEDAEPTKLAYAIRNIMFDESTFDLLMNGVSASYSVLCSHGQLTYRLEDEDLVHDEHIFRSPAVLSPVMNSATMHAALSAGPGGFAQVFEGKYLATLTISDAHAANIRLLRFVDQQLCDDQNHFFLPSLCLQHRVGNIVEQLTKFLGNLGGNFSIAKVLNKGNLLKDLRAKADGHIARTLRVLKETPAALTEEWSQAQQEARDLIQLCMSYNDTTDPIRSGTQREAFQRLADFFNGPWTGPSFAGTVLSECNALSEYSFPEAPSGATALRERSRRAAAVSDLARLLVTDSYGKGQHPMHCVLELPNGAQCWLGGIGASGDVQVLIANGIGAILAAASHPPVIRDSRIDFLGNLDGTGVVHGDIDQGLVINMFQRIIKLLSSGMKVLISCKNGAHRSSFLMALLIIFLTGEPSEVVYSHLNSLRAIVDLSTTAPESRHTHGRKNVRPIDALGKMQQIFAEEGYRSLTRLTRPAQHALGFDQVARSRESTEWTDAGAYVSARGRGGALPSLPFKRDAEAMSAESGASESEAAVGAWIQVSLSESDAGAETSEAEPRTPKERSPTGPSTRLLPTPKTKAGKIVEPAPTEPAYLPPTPKTKASKPQETQEQQEQETQEETQPDPSQRSPTGPSTPRAGFDAEDFATLNKLMNNLKELDEKLKGDDTAAAEQEEEEDTPDWGDADDPSGVSPGGAQEELPQPEPSNREEFRRLMELLEEQQRHLISLMAQREAESQDAQARQETAGMGLIEAIFNQEEDLALALIKSLRPGSIENMADPAGMTPLHWAVRTQSLSILWAILEKTPGLADRPTSIGRLPPHWTPLMVLADQGKNQNPVHVQMASALVRHMSINGLQCRGGTLATVSHLAAARGHIHILKKVLWRLNDLGQHKLVMSHLEMANSVAEARVKASSLVSECLLRPVVVPALNKWTKVFPCIGACVLLGSFSDVAQSIFRERFGDREVHSLSELDSSDDADDEALHVPINEVKRWIKLAKKRNAKATSFLCDGQARFLNMLWVLVAAPCMKLHWILFKTATWYSDRGRKQPGPTASDVQEQILTVGQFCVPSKNPGKKVMKELQFQLEDPSSAFRLLCFFFGEFEDWPQARKRIALRSILLTIGQLARKVIEPFLSYPWKLYELSLPDIDLDYQKRLLRELCNAPACCLDAGFSGKLKALVVREGAVEQGLSTELREFMFVVFERVVLTSTFVERRFAHFNHWTDVKGKGVSLALLAAKHITRVFQDAVEVWKHRIQAPRSQSWSRRPSWCRKSDTVARQNGMHLFAQDRRQSMSGSCRGSQASRQFLEESQEAWKLLSDEEKKSWGERARQSNARKAALQMAAAAKRPPDVPGGPWKLSQPSAQWPLSEKFLTDFRAQHTFASAQNRWCQVFGPLDQVREIDIAVRDDRTLFQACPHASCVADCSEEETVVFGRLHTCLSVLIKRFDPAKKNISALPLTLLFECKDQKDSAIFMLAFRTYMQNVDAIFLELDSDKDLTVDSSPPFTLKFKKERLTGSIIWNNDLSVCKSLATRSRTWDISRLTLGDLQHDLSSFLVCDKLPHDLQDLLSEAAQLKEQERALRAVRLLQRAQRMMFGDLNKRRLQAQIWKGPRVQQVMYLHPLSQLEEVREAIFAEGKNEEEMDIEVAAYLS